MKIATLESKRYDRFDYSNEDPVGPFNPDDQRAIEHVFAEARSWLPELHGPARKIVQAALETRDHALTLARDVGSRHTTGPFKFTLDDALDTEFSHEFTPEDRHRDLNSGPIAYALTVMRIAQALSREIAQAMLDADDLECKPREF